MDERDGRFAEWDAEFFRATGKHAADLLDPEAAERRRADTAAAIKAQSGMQNAACNQWDMHKFAQSAAWNQQYAALADIANQMGNNVSLGALGGAAQGNAFSVLRGQR